MLTDSHAPIGGRYRMYKEGGDRITRWLVSTASSCRRSWTVASTARGKVSTGELLKYAQLISSWKPPIEIPGNITELLQDVVIGREVCAEFYASQDMACKGHQHMIEVLQKVLAVLLEARRKRKKEKTKGKQAHALPEHAEATQLKTKEALNNLFENLQIEEPCEEAWATAPKKRLTQPAVPVDWPTLEVDEKEEKMFVLFCFLKDMQEMRALVKDTWQEYGEKKIAAVTASMVTEAALGIMSCANETLTEAHPSFAEVDDVLAFLHLRLDTDADGKPGLYATSSVEQGQAVDNELTQMLCPEAIALTKGLQGLFSAARATARDRKANGASTKEQWRYEEKVTPPGVFSLSSFGTLLYRLFPDLFRLVKEHKDCKGFSNEFQYGLVQVGAGNLACLWFISAIQLYSEIDKLTKGGNTPFYQYCMMDARTHRVMSQVYDSQIGQTAQRSTLYLPIIEEAKKQFEQAFIGNIAALKYDQSYQHTLMIDENWLPAEVWTSFPAWSGIMIDRVFTWQSHVKHSIANDASIILASAYLYKACRHGNLVLQRWKDMDWFLEQAGQEGPFIHEVGPEGNMATFSRRLFIGIGMSAASFSRDNDRLEARGLRSEKQMFDQRRVFETGSAFLRLAEQLADERRISGKPKRWCMQTALQKEMSRRMQEQVGRAAKRRRRQVAFTGLEMLKFFKQQRLDDEPGLHFDLIAFFMACRRMLWDVRVRWKGEQLASRPEWDHILVAEVLQDGQSAEDEGKPLTSSAMGDAADVLEEYISKQGSRYTDEAFVLARGEMPVNWTDEARALVRSEVPAAWLADVGHYFEAEMLPGSATSDRSSLSAQLGPVLRSERSCTCAKVEDSPMYQAKVETVAEDEAL
ncbi:hypothetical protein CLAFUR4_08606 [Fulvia fulva]|nr:hypothetical protein CLAFUR4_08606 [Fulvia fulva]WPV27041.1 hypothetical protein CLAFUW7_08601 [Fulvia fulva]